MSYTLEKQIGHLLRRANQRHTAIFQDMIGTAQLTPRQFAVLAKLDEVKESSQNELGRLTSMDPATTQGVIKRLLERGMVSRYAMETDLRRKLLCISPYGKKVLKKTYARAHLITQKTLEPLTEKEQESLLLLLQKIT